MIPRYTNSRIQAIWSDQNKTRLWDCSELAAVQASEELGEFPAGVYQKIAASLAAHPVDLEWWLAKDKEIHHDLNAYLEERLRFIVKNLQIYFHRYMTSFDTEEPAFGRMLRDSVDVVLEMCAELDLILASLARRYQYTVMIGRSHQQGGDLQTFGKRVCTWLRDLRTAAQILGDVSVDLKYSKMSGAMGNYGLFKPEVERRALAILGFEPYVGATQIMPRVLYVPVAAALSGLVSTISKIGNDIRLGARSPKPICQEPFKKKQKGSSAMPHKKNPIRCEQLEGMARVARGFLSMNAENVQTDEERAIEQSSVERIAWPDLFHVTCQALDVLTQVTSGLKVYPDNMLWELVQSRGCYAASQAKEVLKTMGEELWNDAEEPYRIVQLAAFNVFEPSQKAKRMREFPETSFAFAENFLMAPHSFETECVTIQEVIVRGRLRVSDELDADEAVVQRWNRILDSIFADERNRDQWTEIFRPAVLLAHESAIFAALLGE